MQIKRRRNNQKVGQLAGLKLEREKERERAKPLLPVLSVVFSQLNRLLIGP